TSGTYKAFDSNGDAFRHFVQVRKPWRGEHNGGLTGFPGLAMDNYNSRNAGGILTRKALRFLDNAIGENRASGFPQPFFLFFAPPQMHRPVSPPQYFNVTHSNDEEPANSGDRVAGYTGSERTDAIREIDLILGAIVDGLEERGQIDNTLIIFTSDNGPFPWADAQHMDIAGLENGVALRGSKGQIYEGGHRIPFIAHWGAGLAAQMSLVPGAESNALVGLHDLAATFYSMLGLQRPPFQANDSKSFLPVILGEGDAGESRRDHLIAQGTPKSAGQENLIDRAFYKQDSMGRTWKLSVISSSTDPLAKLSWKELYDISSDPGETTDRINDPGAQDILKALKAEYLRLIAQPRTIDSYL
ncbi:MAG: sulfatase-like hydrolase/transferase, partial [Gammaproteobacteria bacterium]